jgi:hypothetical protein
VEVCALSTLDPAREAEDRPTRPHLTSIPVDPLSAHIASMIRTLDDEVTRLRDEAAAEAERLVDDARRAAERIVADATRQAAEAEARRDSMLERRAEIIRELQKIRDTIVGLSGRFEQERPDLTPGRRATSSGRLPPPPRGRAHDENQQALFDGTPSDAAGTSGDDEPSR